MKFKKKKKRRHEMLERRNSGRRDPGVNNMRGKEAWPLQWRISVMWYFFLWKLKFIFKNSNTQFTCTLYKFTWNAWKLVFFLIILFYFFMCLIKGMVFYDRCLILFQCKNSLKKKRSWLFTLVSSLTLWTLKENRPPFVELKNLQNF